MTIIWRTLKLVRRRRKCTFNFYKDLFPYKSYPLRHRLISLVRDMDVKGIRKLSVLLPKILIPDAKKVNAYVLKTLHGFYLKIDPKKDKGVELSLHETGTYEKGILLFLKSFLNPGDCFIDVGANIGLISIFASYCVGNNGKVLAYEALPRTAELLQENIALNRVKNIEVNKFALGSTEGSAMIYENWQINRGGASLLVKTEDSIAIEVEIYQLDTVLPEDYRPKMIKIDVEGFELEVLKGAKETIRKFHPVLIVELSENRKNVHESSIEIIDWIKTLGNYRFYKLKGGKERKSKLVEINSNEELPRHDNIVCISN